MQMYGDFEGIFPSYSVLFGLVSYNDTLYKLTV